MLTPTTLDVKNEEYTRFDKYKSKYMGRYNSVDQSKTDMSYADFGALVTAQEYSFKNGDILTGTVVQYDGPQKALVEVGAKTAAVLLGYNYNSSEWYEKSYQILNKDYKSIKIDKKKDEVNTEVID